MTPPRGENQGNSGIILRWIKRPLSGCCQTRSTACEPNPDTRWGEFLWCPYLVTTLLLLFDLNAVTGSLSWYRADWLRPHLSPGGTASLCPVLVLSLRPTQRCVFRNFTFRMYPYISLSVSVVQILKLWFTVSPVLLVDSPFQGEDSAFRVPSLWWAIEKTNKQEKQSWKASLKFQVKEYVWQKTPPISPSPGSSEDHCHLQSSLQVQQ